MQLRTPHAARVLDAIPSEGWATSSEVSKRARVSARTARKHLHDFVQAEFLEVREAGLGGFRYRLAPDRAEQVARSLDEARAVFT